MTVQKRTYNNGVVYSFKTDLLTVGELSGKKALNFVSAFNDGKSIAIIQRFWTDEVNANERVLRESQNYSYIERAICVKPETLAIINQIIDNELRIVT